MTETNESKQSKKGFWSRLIEKLDHKMEEKARKSAKSPCCGGSGEKKDSSCC